MNISRAEQRTLHCLAQGGRILLERVDGGDITRADCVSRDGWTLGDCTLSVFRRLKRRRLIASYDRRPYGITREGLAALRPQFDNRVSAKHW